MSREIKIGILTLVVMITMIWGYTFLKGPNLLTTNSELLTTYADVTDLNVSSPVMVNGYKIGTVTKIKLNPDNVKLMDVHYLIEGDYKIPKNAVAKLKSLGFVSGKGIFLEFDKPCTGGDCAQNGDKLVGQTIGLIGSMLGEEETSNIGGQLKDVISSLGAEGQEGALNDIIRNLQKVTANLADLSANANILVSGSSANFNKTMANFAILSESLAKSNTKIEGLLANVENLTGDLAKANLDVTIKKTNETLDASKTAIASLQTTITSAGNTMRDLDILLKGVNRGEGSLGQLMKDKDLYNNLESSTRNLNLLLQDFRLNPKRYAHFSIFGKSQKEYTPLSEDPELKK